LHATKAQSSTRLVSIDNQCCDKGSLVYVRSQTCIPTRVLYLAVNV